MAVHIVSQLFNYSDAIALATTSKENSLMGQG